MRQGLWEAGAQLTIQAAYRSSCRLEFLEKVLGFPKVLYDPRSCCSLTEPWLPLSCSPSNLGKNSFWVAVWRSSLPQTCVRKPEEGRTEGPSEAGLDQRGSSGQNVPCRHWGESSPARPQPGDEVMKWHCGATLGNGLMEETPG